MNVTVVGAGYVGLVTAAGYAELGHHVVCVDVDPARIAILKAGCCPLFEPGLDLLVGAGVRADRLRFTESLGDGMATAEVVVVAVGTPALADGAADPCPVLAVVNDVAALAKRPLVLVVKSTVPVGTHARISAHLVGTTIEVACNPEFLREGTAVDDVRRPDRIVVGLAPGRVRARAALESLYASQAGKILWMDPESAELTKSVANTMLAMRISFMNDIALLCERTGADVTQVARGVGADHRIGPHYLRSGAGYGGSCLPRDVLALVATARAHGVALPLAEATHAVNERQKDVLLAKLERHFDHDLRGREVAVWGVSYKPDTDDLRDAPALRLVQGLLAGGAGVRVHDPAAGAALRLRLGPAVTVFDSEYDAAAGADAMVLVTEWHQYATPDFGRLSRLMRRPFVVDGRNLWVAADLVRHGFRYEGIGVPA